MCDGIPLTAIHYLYLYLYVMAWAVGAICPKSWGVRAWGHLSPSANHPFSLPSRWLHMGLGRAVRPLPNILMQFIQSIQTAL